VTPDLELARRCREGDAAAFETLYRTHAGRLFGLLTRMTGSAQDAEDLLQDVFVQAHRKLASFRGESSLGTWLYRMAVNQCLDSLRGKQSRMAREWFGDAFVQHFAATREWEEREFRKHITDWELARYFEII
jgi:RNA polymerase sigma factor (sigma-70 family)